jgi:phosphoribosylformylglycinamidine cyclo-ligase
MEEHGVPREESERAFNCGVGMVGAVSPAVADAVVDQLGAAGISAWVAGGIERRTDDAAPAAHLVGTYR